MSNLELKNALALALIDAWEAGTTMRAMIMRLSQESGADADAIYKLLGEATRKQWVADVLVKNYVKTNFPMLSDALWDARSTAGILNAARRAVGLGAKKGTVARLGVGTRALDKSHDWSTVK